ncbi:hypothetical protein NC652_041664 [Populus alba x Populus x berolinensis]|nr:hypothetical protein NC652_041664 [Populus alba x Populus x berolinensis]
MVLLDILSSKCLKEDINISCYHLLRHDYLLSLIPLRPPGFPFLTYIPAYFLSSKFELFEVHVCKECLAFLQVYSWKVDTCSDVST